MKRTIATALLVLLVACGNTGEAAEESAAADPSSWEEVVEAAEGQTVNFYLWGGNENINQYVDEILAPFVQEEYGIAVTRVPVSDTVEAVNKVIGELQAGRTDDGTVDLVWIDGENYRTMRQAEALHTGWERDLPNAEYVDWESESVNRNFGIPVEGMSPWSNAFFQMVYDSERLDESEVPRTFEELREWILANPGRFTYPSPPDFYGNHFIEMLFYEQTGGYEQWIDFDQAAFDEAAEQTWSYLEEIAPALWRNGSTYPSDVASLDQLFANGEVDFTFTQTTAGIGGAVATGQLPETARPYVLDSGSVGGYNYLGIPANAANRTAAQVVANAALDPEMQIAMYDPANGWATGMALDLPTLDTESQERIEAITAELTPYGLAPEVIQERAVPDVSPDLIDALEAGWDERIRRGAG